MTPPLASARAIRLRHGGYGVLATLVGVAAAHLLAALTTPSASPVLAVGSRVVDLTPTPVKEWAVRELGTADKPVLVGSVLVGVLLLSAVAGVLAVSRPLAGVGLLVLLSCVGAAAAALAPTASLTDALPSLVAAAVAGASLLWLHAQDPGSRAGQPSDGGPSSAASRRGLLLATGGLVVAAAMMGGLGRLVTAWRIRTNDVVLPTPGDALPPLPSGLEGRVPGISAFRTPTDDFYRVDTRLTLPLIDVDEWRLSIDGDVEREVSLSFEDLAAMSTVERDLTLTCVSNEVGGPYVGSARWLGVPLRDVLDLAGIDATGADQILSTDVDGMTISTPLRVALDGRESLLAIGMNGTALPLEHGFPARMVVPGLYGFVSACKWITRMTLTTYDAQQAYWTERDWATEAPIKVSSRIDTPRPLSESRQGRTFIGGVAWAQHDGIARVEVRVDGGPWREATLGPDAGDDYWRQWHLPWEATPGQHFLASRATTRSGVVQTAVRAAPFPAGSSGIQEIAVRVV